MMDRETLLKTMEERNLTVGEVLSHGFSLLSGRFGQYLLLSVLVFLPINLIQNYFSMQVDLSAFYAMDMEQLVQADLTPFMNDMAKTLAAAVGGQFLSLIAVLVSAVMVKNQLLDPENHGFGTLFYRGIRMWPRAALTVVLVLMQTFIGCMCAGMLMAFPLLGLLAIVLVVYVAIRYIMYENLCGAVAALRGRLGFDNMHYVKFLLQKSHFKVLGIFAIITLLSNGITLGVSLLSTNILSFSGNALVRLIIATLISTILSILNIFGYVCGTLILLNLEEMKRRELKRMALQEPDPNRREVMESTLEAMEERMEHQKGSEEFGNDTRDDRGDR
ncbi:MAG: hypothetical protein HUJ69_05240 [Lachnospiraceae bacterium]|nr:hypothetical protein [Lachnospiraceae bacterium]